MGTVQAGKLRVGVDSDDHGGSEGGEWGSDRWGGRRRNHGMSCEKFASGRGCGKVDLEGQRPRELTGAAAVLTEDYPMGNYGGRGIGN